MEAVAWWLAEMALRIVVAALFLSMAWGWCVSILFWCGKFRWVNTIDRKRLTRPYHGAGSIEP